jgi:hypothetical protein
MASRRRVRNRMPKNASRKVLAPLLVFGMDSSCAVGSAALGVLAALSPALVDAQTNIAERAVDVRYFYYNDRQNGSQDRMEVQAPMVRVASPLTDSSHLQGTFVLDGMTGASPLYLDTLTGASKRGVEDTRYAGSLVYTHQMEEFEIQVGAEASSEDDYEAKGFSVLTTAWSDDKNRSLSFGLSESLDDISSTNNPTLDEFRRTFGVFAGYTQVIDEDSIMQINLQGTSAEGYLTDQYKSGDSRPRGRDSFSALTRYNRYISDISSALHFDYRYFRDSWSVIAHTMEVSLHSQVTSDIIVRPLVRYHTQGKAGFFSEIYPQNESALFGSNYFSADQRMAGFGALSSGLKVLYQMTPSCAIEVLYEFYHQDPRLKAGSEGSAGIPTLYAQFFGTGFRWSW